MVIGTACHDDIFRLQATADAAYRIYLPRMDRKPAPMLADFSRHIDKDVVFVAADAVVMGYAVLCARDDGWQLDNIAVDPARQGQGIGLALVKRCEQYLRQAGVGAYQLYTNVVMTKPIGWYQSLGFQETGRRNENGYRRVYFAKEIG